MALPDLGGVYALVERQYSTIIRETSEARDDLQAAKSHRSEIFHSKPRRVSDAGMYCIDRFTSSELDFVTPGIRGMGRVSEIVPRFAAKHRKVFAKMLFDAKTDLTEAIHMHIACGYLLIDFLYPDFRSDPSQFDNSTLFDEWVSMIYSPPKAIEPQDEDEWQLWGLWFAATGKPINEIATRVGIEWDYDDHPASDQNIITKYFDAGTTLRYAEALLTQHGPSGPPIISDSTQSAASTRKLPSVTTTLQPPQSTVNIGWVIAGAIALVVLLWICGGGLSGDPTFDPYIDDPLRDPDLYREGPWPR